MNGVRNGATFASTSAKGGRWSASSVGFDARHLPKAVRRHRSRITASLSRSVHSGQVQDCFGLFGEDRIRIPNVWTGGVLQGETLSAGTLGLALMYPAYQWSV